MKRLVVCGDSYMSPVLGKYADSHFSQIIAKELGWELIPLARGGCSNGAICIQLNTVISMNPTPDLVLIGNTVADRIEWPISDIRPIEKFTVNELLYDNETSLSYDYFSNTDPHLASWNLSSMLQDPQSIKPSKNDKYHTERVQAIKLYFEYLYHPVWKKEIDKMMTYSCYHRLHKSGVPYIICYDHLNLLSQCEWILPKNDACSLIEQCLYQYNQKDGFHEPEYHTDPRSQVLMAEQLLKNKIPNLLQ